jgi:hypothetical protein
MDCWRGLMNTNCSLRKPSLRSHVSLCWSLHQSELPWEKTFNPERRVVCWRVYPEVIGALYRGIRQLCICTPLSPGESDQLDRMDIASQQQASTQITSWAPFSLFAMSCSSPTQTHKLRKMIISTEISLLVGTLVEASAKRFRPVCVFFPSSHPQAKRFTNGPRVDCSFLSILAYFLLSWSWILALSWYSQKWLESAFRLVLGISLQTCGWGGGVLYLIHLNKANNKVTVR